MSLKTCIVIVGPTAVGKTAMAIEIARHYNTKIISADSRQCYRELNIGVAKPDPAQLAAIPHYFINSHSIFQEVNAAAFESYALNAADEIFRTAAHAVVVGGTGLYIKAFCEGMDDIPSIPIEIRKQVTDEYDKLGLGWLQAEVKLSDPEYFNSAEIHNPQRLMRALEVKRSTGSTITSFHSSSRKKRPFQVIKVGFTLPRAELYNRINERVEDMIKKGLSEEARELHPYAHLNALQTVGYKELFACFNGEDAFNTAVANIKKHTRQYAKRQMTWFKKDIEVSWFSPGELSRLITILDARIIT